jgi:hypothetical protein
MRKNERKGPGMATVFTADPGGGTSAALALVEASDDEWEEESNPAL